MSYIKNGKNKLNSLLTNNKALYGFIFKTINDIHYNLGQPHAKYLSGSWFETVFNNELGKIIKMEEKHFEIIGILIKLAKKNKAREGYQEGIDKEINN